MRNLIHALKYKEPRLRDYNGDPGKRWAVFWYVFDTKKEQWDRQIRWISTNTSVRERYAEAELINKGLKWGFSGDNKKRSLK